MKLTFKNKWEFACAIKEHGKLWYIDGDSVFYDEGYITPFRYGGNGLKGNQPMDDAWDAFNQGWTTTEPLKHLDLVWAWDKDHTHSRILGIWDKVIGNVFANNGTQGIHWDNYEKYTGELPQWYLDAIKKIKTNSK